MESKDSFPVDVKPLVRSVVLLIAVFVVLCVTAYMQQGEAVYRTGVALLAAVFGFSAYAQRSDRLRMVAILAVGVVLCLFLLLYAGEETESVTSEQTERPIRQALPEGM